MDFEIGDFEKYMYAFLITSAHNTVILMEQALMVIKKIKIHFPLQTLIKKLKKELIPLNYNLLPNT
jgi:hypothetical protein